MPDAPPTTTAGTPWMSMRTAALRLVGMTLYLEVKCRSTLGGMRVQGERPLPQPSPSSEPFWKSGADGVLRIARCEACRRYHHPPQPICPGCRSTDVVMTEVSGRAVIAGF